MTQVQCIFSANNSKISLIHLPVSNKWIQEKSPNHTPNGSSRGSRVSTAEADEPTKREVDMFEFHDEAENSGIRADIEGFLDEK
jgi:hypothetical protein